MQRTRDAGCRGHRPARDDAQGQKVVVLLLRMHPRGRGLPGPARPHVTHSLGSDAKLSRQAPGSPARHGPELRKVDRHGLIPRQSPPGLPGGVVRRCRWRAKAGGVQCLQGGVVCVAGVTGVAGVIDGGDAHGPAEQAADLCVGPPPAPAPAHQGSVLFHEHPHHWSSDIHRIKQMYKINHEIYKEPTK